MEERAVVGLEYNMPDTFASFYSSSATRKAGAVAALDEERKWTSILLSTPYMLSPRL